MECTTRNFATSCDAPCKELLKTGHVMDSSGWKLEALLGKDLRFP